jgi:hypothetical protein
MDPRARPWAPHSVADAHATTLIVFVDRRRLEIELRQALPMATLDDVAGAPSGRHPLLLDLWRIDNGHLTPAGIDMLNRSGLLGGLMGGVAGAAVGAATLGSYAGLIGMLRPPRTAAARSNSWVVSGWSALANQCLGAALGSLEGARVGASLGVRGVQHATQRSVHRWGSYQEILLALPNVRIGSAPARCQLVLGMYTDSGLARWGERVLGYGYGKRPARIRFSDTSAFEASTPSGARLLRGRWPGADDFELYERPPPCVPEWLSQPLLGLRRGRPVFSRLDRQWIPKESALRQLAGSLEVGPDLLPGILARSYEISNWERARTNAEMAVGFQTRGLRLQLSFPRPSSTSAEAAEQDS